jgi:hypothetical protein
VAAIAAVFGCRPEDGPSPFALRDMDSSPLDDVPTRATSISAEPSSHRFALATRALENGGRRCNSTLKEERHDTTNATHDNAVALRVSPLQQSRR